MYNALGGKYYRLDYQLPAGDIQAYWIQTGRLACCTHTHTYSVHVHVQVNEYCTWGCEKADLGSMKSS